MQINIQKDVKEEVLKNGDVRLVYDEVNNMIGGLFFIAVAGCALLAAAFGVIGIFAGQFLLSIPLLLISAVGYLVSKNITSGLKNKSFTITPDSGVRFNNDKDYAKFDDISFVSCNSVGGGFYTLCIHVGGNQASLTGTLPQSRAQDLFRLFKLHSQRDWG